MSDQRIVFTRPNGSVSIIIPAPNCPLSFAEIKAKDVPTEATNVREITTADLPSNRNYRGAWDDSNDGKTVGVNAAKAGEIAHGRRRTKRDEVFKPHLKVTGKAAQGIPLAANENATDAANAMSEYKADVDDAAQSAIDDAVAADDIVAIEAAEIAAGLL